MLRSWLRNLARRWRREPSATAPACPRRENLSTPPTLEVLEDRCLPSAATTVPAPVGNFPLVGLEDIVMAAQPKVDSNIVFLGDSITFGFAYGPGAPIWSALMIHAGATNYGVVGQTTQSLLFQLALGQLTGVHTSVVVLTIGTNNLLMGDSPEATAAGILADVNAIHLAEPTAQVLVLGVPPGAPAPSDAFRNEVEETDALVRQQLAGDVRATFFDIAPALEQANGMISNLVLSDYIHPTALGYADLAVALFSPLTEAFQLATAHTPHRVETGNATGGFQRHLP